MLKKVLMSIILALFVLVAGCQIDGENHSKVSIRILRKGEGAESRMVSPFGDYDLPMVGQNSTN